MKDEDMGNLHLLKDWEELCDLPAKSEAESTAEADALRKDKDGGKQ